MLLKQVSTCIHQHRKHVKYLLDVQEPSFSTRMVLQCLSLIDAFLLQRMILVSHISITIICYKDYTLFIDVKEREKELGCRAKCTIHLQLCCSLSTCFSYSTYYCNTDILLHNVVYQSPTGLAFTLVECWVLVSW